MESVKNSNGKAILMKMVKGIQENEQYLGKIDSYIGDGDHGVNMNKVFSLFAENIKDGEISLSEGLDSLSSILFNQMNGSIGPIYGTIFMNMADASAEKDEITLDLFTHMMESAREGLYEIVDARPGDKTLADTLHPAVESLKDSCSKGIGFKEALKLMKNVAEDGSESTKGMTAKYGRYAKQGDRSKGVLDVGACSCRIILESLADGIIEALERG